MEEKRVAQRKNTRGDLSNVKRKNKESRKSAPDELEPHFILDLGFSFQSLMAAPTAIVSLVMTYTSTHSFFFPCNGLH
jgi:hypothetical protein